jgi:CDP-glycerol glycerophosphotransferase (TagB/SpsB family)
VRFHPAVSEEERKLFLERGWEISNPEAEQSLDFILRCNTIVSSDSSILLEAILLKRRSIYFSSDKQAMDYYGFAKQGIVEKICLSWREVMDLLETEFELEKYRRKAKYFHDPLYTEWEGRSTELAIRYIEELTGIECGGNGESS